MINTEALRKKIIDLAIQGNLTQQLPEDGDAEDLYTTIQEKKEKLIKEGKIRKEKALPNISDEEIPFEIPVNWKWVRFASVAIIVGTGMIRPGNEQFDKAGYYYFKMNNIGNFDGICHFENMVMVNASADEYEQYKLEEGDFLFNTRNSKELVGKTATVPKINERIIFNNNILKVRFLGGIFPEYITYYFISSTGRSILSMLSTSTTNVAAIYQKQLIPLPIPIPPIDEQKRIVEKLDEVLSLIDTIDALQQQYESDCEVLKGKIIDAGIQGKLTEQLPEDGNAEDLYAQIQKEKSKLIKEGKIKKEKPLSEISDDEVPLEIPSNWKWVRIGDVTYNHGQKTPQNRFCYIDVGTLDNVNHRLNENENIVESNAAPSRAKKIVKYGDVLYSMVRPYLHNICVVNREFPYEPIASTAFAVMHTYDDYLLNRYLYYWLLSKWFDKYVNGDSSKGTLYPAIGEKDFFKGLMPLAPIEEQKRIVQRISELLYYCV